MVAFQVGPEQAGEHLGLVDQRGVVEDRAPLGEVVHQDLTHGAVGDRVAVDQLGRGSFAGVAMSSEGGWAPRQRARGVQRMVGQSQRLDRPSAGLAGGGVVADVSGVQARDVLAGADRHTGQQVQRVHGVFGAPADGGQVLAQLREDHGLVVPPKAVVDAQQAAGEQPLVGRADGAQHQQGAKTGGETAAPGRCQPGRAPRRAGGIGAAEQPTVLPGVAGKALEPEQHGRYRTLLVVALRRGGHTEQALCQAEQLGHVGLCACRRSRSAFTGNRRGRRVGRRDRVSGTERCPHGLPVAGHRKVPNRSVRSVGSKSQPVG